ncbi:MAG: hypothetical protein V1899_02930 [Planctomycetota bacterium]
MIPSVGDYVRVNVWNGVVRAVFRVEGAPDNPFVEIEFVKNIFKGQPSETHRWLDLAPHTATVSWQALLNEIVTTQERMQIRFDALGVPE